jgi:alkylation response protein AidB-like acyl-CoA dehydrogenase
MRLGYDEETERFRADLVSWLDANLPAPEELAEPKESSAHLPDWARRWQRRLFDAGWLVPGWPPELGGRNATAVQSMVYFEELSRRNVPRALNPQGLGIVAPSLLEFGTEEQREAWLLPTLRGEVTWCLGMSEPNAGSDFAGLRTRAERSPDGGHFVVNGQKVWTSGAHHADLCFCFVRTDLDAPKHKGISVLVVDMKTEGIRCRPLPELTDKDFADFNEVFFTDVAVPAGNLIGELNDGWRISMTSLGHERGMLWIGQQTQLERSVEALVSAATGTFPHLLDDEVFRDQLASLHVDAEAMKYLGYRGFAKFAAGRDAPEHSILKLYGSEAERRLNLVATNALGPAAWDEDEASHAEAYREGPWAAQYLRAFSNTIAGGTSEIQRNIIAERILGLPRR